MASGLALRGTHTASIARYQHRTLYDQTAVSGIPWHDTPMAKMNAGYQSSTTKADKSGSGSLRELLSGRDRRSIARANDVLARARANIALVADLAGLADDDDWLVAERALDVLEKLAHEHPDWVAPYKNVFIGELADSDKWEIRLQIVRALPLFDWPAKTRRRAVEILCRDVEHSQTFVKAWALDSLATFAQKQPELMPVVHQWLADFDRSGSKALAARARNIRARLSYT